MPNRFETQPVHLATGNPERENNATLHAPGTLGMRFTVIQPTRSAPAAGSTAGRSKRYQIVRTDSTMSASPALGATMWWSDRINYVVTNVAATTTRGQVAGIFQNNHLLYPVTPGNYCCIQIGGPGLVRYGAGTPTASGQFVIPYSVSGQAEILAAAAAATYPTIGRTESGPINGQTLCIVNIDIDETT